MSFDADVDGPMGATYPDIQEKKERIRFLIFLVISLALAAFGFLGWLMGLMWSR